MDEVTQTMSELRCENCEEQPSATVVRGYGVCMDCAPEVERW